MNRGMSVSANSGHWLGSAFEAGCGCHSQTKDRLAAVLLNKVSIAKAQRVLMRIEAGWPDSLKRLTGVILVPLTFKIERS